MYGENKWIDLRFRGLLSEGYGAWIGGSKILDLRLSPRGSRLRVQGSELWVETNSDHVSVEFYVCEQE